MDMPIPSPAPAANDRPFEADAALNAQVNHCRWRLKLRAFLRRTALLIAAAAIVPLLVVVADHAWTGGLPRWLVLAITRTWATAFGLAAVGLIGVTVWQRLNPLFAARLLEHNAGIRHNSLVNALQLKDAPAGAYAYSAAARQAVLDVDAHPAASVAEPGAFRLPALVAGAVLAGWLVYAVLAPKPIAPSLARFFGADIAAPTATRLELVRPGPNDGVHAGESLEIEVAVSGHPADEVTFERSNADEATSGREELIKRTEGRGVDDDRSRTVAARGRQNFRPKPGGPSANWILQLAPHEVTRDIHYVCRAKDALLRGTIPVQPRPAVDGLEIELHPPPYTGQPPRTVVEPDLDVLAGTRALFRLRSNGPLRNAAFVLNGTPENRTRMTISAADPHAASVSVVLLHNGTYRFEFSDAWGYSFRDPPSHALRVRPDRPPEVLITQPREGEYAGDEIDVRELPAIEALAHDDVRIAELLLVEDHGGVVTRSQVGGGERAAGRRVIIKLPTAEILIPPGQSAQVWFEARDNRAMLDGTAAPQMARSRVLTLNRPPEDRRPRVHPVDTEDGEPGAGGDAEAGQAPGQDEEQGTAAEGAPGDPDSSRAEGPGQAAGGDDPGAAQETKQSEFEDELQRFVKEHGDEARKLSPSGDESGTPDSQPGENPPEENASQPGSDAAEQAPEGDQPGGEQTPPTEVQPADADHAGEPANPPPPEVPPEGSPASQPAEEAEAPSGESSESEPAEGEAPPAGSETPPSETPPAEQDPGAGAGAEDQPETGVQEPETGGGPQPGEQPAGAPEQGGGGGPGAESQPAEESQGPRLIDTPPLAPTSRPALDSAGLAETLDLLEMLDRGGQVTPEELVALGWMPADAARFVTALERLYEAAQLAGGIERVRIMHFDARVGSADVQEGAGFSEDVDTAVDPARAPADLLKRIAAPPEQHTPAHLRRLLDAYYRSLAEDQPE